MNRFLLALPVLAIAASSAFAATTSVTNNSGLPIDELFASAPGAANWGANLMEGIGEGALDTGKTHDVAFLQDGTYDFQISAPDEGVLCVMSNVQVKGGQINLTEDMGKACD